MIIPRSIAEKLISMQNGEKIPVSNLNHSVIKEMLDNGVLKTQIQGRSKKLIYISNKNLLIDYLKNHFGIESLDNYVEGCKRENLTRADAIDISSNSKMKSIRTFKGFLVNCFEPVECLLDKKAIIIQPTEGTFTFIYDFENFIPNANITIIGIENPENFRYIEKQKNLFKGIQPLFVSRYPQSKDLIKWIQSIPNNYLHFGDFDIAGLNIYFNEYKKYLQDKAAFFLPLEIERLLSTKGNRDNYNKQSIAFDQKEVKEENILTLIRLIHKYKKGLEQEIFIKN